MSPSLCVGNRRGLFSSVYPFRALIESPNFSPTFLAPPCHRHLRSSGSAPPEILPSPPHAPISSPSSPTLASSSRLPSLPRPFQNVPPRLHGLDIRSLKELIQTPGRPRSTNRFSVDFFRSTLYLRHTLLAAFPLRTPNAWPPSSPCTHPPWPPRVLRSLFRSRRNLASPSTRTALPSRRGLRPTFPARTPPSSPRLPFLH